VIDSNEPRIWKSGIEVRISSSIDLELQEMCGARDAGVIIANSLFTLPRKSILWKINVPGNKLQKVALDDLLVLRSRWDNFRFKDDASIVKTIAMVKDASRSFCATIS
jgi:hypothetical protein